MDFMNDIIYGIHLWVISVFVVGLIIGLIIWAYFMRERLIGYWYRFRFPEKTFKIVVHYPGNMYQIFWRLVPDKDTYEVGGKQYFYSDKALQKENEWYVRTGDKKDAFISVEDKRYDLPTNLRNFIKRKGSPFPEIHYIYNCPDPLDFNFSKKELTLTSVDLQEVKENDLFQKLLTLEDEKNIMKVLIIIGIITAILSFANFAKSMGWLK